MSWDKDPYVILGVAPTATDEVIKSAYHRLSERFHPDVNSGSAASAQFKDITQAYEILTDSYGRRSHDERVREQQSDTERRFALRVTPSKHTVSVLPEPQVIYLLADIFPTPRAQTGAQGVALNLTLVLDRSNSMNGARMEKVKIAAHQIIDNMSSNDVLSVITFADRAETIIPATHVTDRPAMKARVSMIGAAGGTEIFQGLNAGMQQIHAYLSPRMVNHIILLTDGHTFGDQDKCLELAVRASREGIGISAMGLGHDWNDEFLDELASKTGGDTMYINSANAVVKFLNDQVRSLANVFADRMHLSVATDVGVHLESAFKLSPHPQPLEPGDGDIPLGTLQLHRPISVLLQFQLAANLQQPRIDITRMLASGHILANKVQAFQAVADVPLDVSSQPVHEDPPTAILDALSKLTLYRLQERASEALDSGNVAEATRRLENLATRLLAIGQDDLATQAITEARRVAHTSGLSDKGRKALKYQTRYLIMDEDSS